MDFNWVVVYDVDRSKCCIMLLRIRTKKMCTAIIHDPAENVKDDKMVIENAESVQLQQAKARDVQLVCIFNGPSTKM